MSYRKSDLQFQSDVGNVVKFSYQNIKHITLICQHDKLPLVIILFGTIILVKCQIVEVSWFHSLITAQARVLCKWYQNFILSGIHGAKLDNIKDYSDIEKYCPEEKYNYLGTTKKNITILAPQRKI